LPCGATTASVFLPSENQRNKSWERKVRKPDAASFAAAAQATSAAVDPMTDVHASAEYRRALAGTMVERALSDAAQRAAA